MMDEQELYGRVRSGLARIIELFGSASEGAQILRWPGVTAAIVPTTPERSLFNAVQFETLSALQTNYADLERTYREAGTRAFSVWIDPGDEQQAALLSARGHKLDGQPKAMAAELNELTLPELDDLDWAQTRDAQLVADLNERAYGFPAPSWRAAFDRLADPRTRAYVARADGQPAASVLTLEGDFGDCIIAGVATLPGFQKRRLASRLLAQALREARERGAITTSLQSSSKGRPVYARLGYRDLGAMSLWERRFA